MDGVVISLAGIVIVLVANIVTVAWWASKITTLLETADKSIIELSQDMKAVNSTYVSTQTFGKEIGHLESKIDKAWEKIDKLWERYPKDV